VENVGGIAASVGPSGDEIQTAARRLMMVRS
jgi:hypothetical protein